MIEEYPKVYWKDREEGKVFAGAASSFGWRHFTPTRSAHWADFPDSFQFSPKVWYEPGKESGAAWEKPRIVESRLSPDWDEWQVLIGKALAAIAAGKFDKCVLAREWVLSLEKPLDPWPLVAALAKRAQNAYVICIQPTPRSAFISITPEKLFSRKKGVIYTEALAGTRKMGEAPFDAKHKREFSLVEDSILQALAPLSGEDLRFSKASIRSVPGGIEHLHSSLEARVKEGVSDQQLLDVLHPTAALLGLPKKEAWRFLEEHEPFDRGLYGAPLGKREGDNSTWAVGIRSCLIFESTLRLYSGVGVVAGSDAKAEWEELDHKLTVFKELLL